jgi:hypothetical protein
MNWDRPSNWPRCDAARVDRLAPDEQVEPHVAREPDKLRAHEFGHLLLEFGDGCGADLQEPFDVRAVDLGTVDLDAGHGVLLRVGECAAPC